jgi:hypothetical protein
MDLLLIDEHYYHIIWNSMDDTITLSGTTWMFSWNQEYRFSLFDALACQNFVKMHKHECYNIVCFKHMEGIFRLLFFDILILGGKDVSTCHISDLSFMTFYYIYTYM